MKSILQGIGAGVLLGLAFFVALAISIGSSVLVWTLLAHYVILPIHPRGPSTRAVTATCSPGTAPENSGAVPFPP